VSVNRESSAEIAFCAGLLVRRATSGLWIGLEKALAQSWCISEGRIRYKGRWIFAPMFLRPPPNLPAGEANTWILKYYQ
jgi:hypothetical protein